MVEITVSGDMLHVKVLGWHKLLTFKRVLDVPMSQVRGVRADREVAQGWFHGWKGPGIDIPGIIAGTFQTGLFSRHRKKSFWDVRDKEKVVVIELAGNKYDRLVVEVEHPDWTVHMIQKAMSDRAGEGATL